MMERPEYARAGHAKGQAHAWGPAPPGHGRLDVCKKCGTKRKPDTENQECHGTAHAGIEPTQHDYDPI